MSFLTHFPTQTPEFIQNSTVQLFPQQLFPRKIEISSSKLRVAHADAIALRAARAAWKAILVAHMAVSENSVLMCTVYPSKWLFFEDDMGSYGMIMWDNTG